MWIEDYIEAIAAVQNFFPNCCWDSISCSVFGDKFNFKPHDCEDWWIVYIRESKAIVRIFKDTWRNPDHYEVVNENWNWGVLK